MSPSVRRKPLSAHRFELVGKQKEKRCNIPSTRQWLYMPAGQHVARTSRRVGAGVLADAVEAGVIRRSSKEIHLSGFRRLESVKRSGASLASSVEWRWPRCAQKWSKRYVLTSGLSLRL